MRLSASEYAARKGITPRAVRFQLQKGKLPGWKELDSETGVETWYVEVSDAEENTTAPSETVGTLLPGMVEIVSTLQNQHHEEVARLHREHLEMAGRLGFYQARIQELERRVLELEAPREAPVDMANHPTSEQSSQDSAVQSASTESKEQSQAEPVSESTATATRQGQEASSGRPLKRFWRWLAQPV